MIHLPKELGLSALQEFQKKYAMSTSGDLQTFVLGYQAAVKDITNLQILQEPCSSCLPGAQFSTENNYNFCGNCGRKIL